MEAIFPDVLCPLRVSRIVRYANCLLTLHTVLLYVVERGNKDLSPRAMLLHTEGRPSGTPGLELERRVIL